MQKLLTTHEVAQMAQVHRDTLLRWLREGRIPEPERDRNGWRIFTPEAAEAVVRHAQNGQQTSPTETVSLKEGSPVYVVSPVTKIRTHVRYALV